MRTILLLFLAVLLLPASPLAAEDDPAKALLTKVGKALASGNAGAVAKHFPSRGKVELRLKGVKAGYYRDKLAHSLLTTYLGKSKDRKYKLEPGSGTVGKFATSYRLRSDGTTVRGTTRVHLRKEGETWLIVGIVES